MTTREYRVLEAVRSEAEGLRFVVVEIADDEAREVALFYRRDEADAYAGWRLR
ncbi:hypothetical protein BN1232_01132 [Mycobacterium lentiflavum]|uniref:Uncharacterized protein n=1 Tax=Mycobacterium lentiflavum TaxID=141349 RepID=A0A0E4CLW1_MYCLN|nr:hypothetical protein [Mycobacterium lentiflavum]CQD06535.1 hypothetical protein BN1232_01132 [Mycobacterium lentiflavum]